MCNDNKCRCEKPKELKDVPAKCSPKQIKACHGDAAKAHPCVPQKKCKAKKGCK